MIIDEILDFENASSIPLKLFINNENFEFSSKENCYFSYFEHTNSLELNIYQNINNNKHVNSYYKNQFVKNSFYPLAFLAVEVNIHKEKASEILALNRNKIKSECEDKLYTQILESLFIIIIKNFSSLFENDIDKQIGSLFLEYYKNDFKSLHPLDLSNYSYWKKYKLSLENNKEIEIDHLINSIKSIKISYYTNNHLRRGDSFSFENGNFIINTSNHTVNSSISQFIFSKIEDKITRLINFEYDENGNLKFVEFSLEPNEGDFISEEKYIEVLEKSKSWNRSSRKIIPCLKKYSKLRLKDEAYIGYVYHFNLDHFIEFKYPKMVSPFVVAETGNYESKYESSIILNDKLYNWVFENRYDPTTTKKEIIENYKNFILEFGQSQND
ncbi:hypothetical protein BOQ62_06120 [Chryseobacterium sp. CH21]|uniref:hypothetical protein n=1 Tax=Chryseobacterium sp. CH21 TaxID=713556 RepID=UPI00100BF855|nr:hypothetical protein [Chryseobacterium sp. CH21]RXM40528.1 hypothetical protein BOQ62_06120 [Chryseobacterium sp. CH21]